MLRVAEVMSSSEQPGQLVMPLRTPHKTPQRKGSTDSVGGSSVRRSLSFTPDSAKQQPEPKAEEQQQVAEQPKPEPKAEEKQVTSAETESQTPKRLLGHSAEERFRITYEARQLLHKVFASPETPIVGSVGRGLLVVPGQWARLSNISEDGKWLRTETFRIGSKEVVHTKGAS